MLSGKRKKNDIKNSIKTKEKAEKLCETKFGTKKKSNKSQ